MCRGHFGLFHCFLGLFHVLIGFARQLDQRDRGWGDPVLPVGGDSGRDLAWRGRTL